MKNININDIVRFKLSKHGEEVLKKYCDNINKEMKDYGMNMDGVDYNKHYCKKIKGKKNGQYREEQIWQLMNIFGQHMYMGGKNIFEGNKWEWKEDDIIKYGK
jgi:hypothetical protein